MGRGHRIATTPKSAVRSLSHVNSPCAGSTVAAHIELQRVNHAIKTYLIGMLDKLRKAVVVECVGRHILRRGRTRTHRKSVMCLRFCQLWQ